MAEKLVTLFKQILDQIPEPRKTIFLERTINYKNPSTLQKLGNKLEYSREGIRLFENETKLEISQLLKNDKYAIFKKTAQTLSNELGNWFPDNPKVLNDAVLAATGHTIETLSEPLVGFLLYLAGPYKLKDSWYAKVKHELPTAKDLHKLAKNDLVVYQDAYKHLTKMGLKPAFVDQMLFKRLKCLRINDYIIVKSGLVGHQYLSALVRAIGKPVTVMELAQMAQLPTTAKSLLNALSKSPEIIRLSKDHWGLKEWGIDEYKGIADAMTEEILKNKGVMSLKELAQKLYEKFGIKPSSVYSYSGIPRFIVSNGIISLRKQKDVLEVKQSITEAKGVFKTSNKVNYLFTIDKNHLRGSGFAIPKALAIALKLEPNSKKSWQSKLGEIRIYWSDAGLHPSAGSIKKIAEKLGLKEGDLIRIEFELNKPVAFIHPVKLTSKASPTDALTELTGLNNLSKPLEAISQAIDSEPELCLAALTSRGDKLVAKYLKGATSKAE
jgi:hypothetical protein